MAAQIPVKISSNNLKQMSTDDKAAIVARAKWLYLADQSVLVTQVGSSGTLDAMNDTRTQAGAATSDATNFHTAGETGDVSTVTVAYDKISAATTGSLSFADSGATTRFPVYVDGSNNLRAMTAQEMYDTYASATIDAIIAAQPYQIGTSTSAPSGYTNVSTTAVFVDTRANREYTEAEFDAIMKEMIRNVAVNLTSHKIRYYIGGSGTNMGSGMVDTKLNSSAYATLQVGDDYRAQEFPAGSAATINTYYLKARKE